MTDWNKVLKDSIGTPEVPGGRGRKKNKIVRTPPKLETVMGNIYTHTESTRKAGAYQRVMGRAMEYRAIEVGRRQAKHMARRKNPNRFDIPVTLAFVFLCCLLVYIIPILADVK